jgi:alpha-amylase/alpha-mannosidase (GH57 family)
MPNVTRYICIHGHFYQPPRENPWLEQVETQDSAAPFHDWNERITSECYAVNGASRILNRQNEIIRILNNYSHISFNFGPTLLSWLEANAPRTYRTVLEGDRASQKRFAGHGSAMAQVYNHIIMPLANTRDRITQIRWGIADFRRRFGRKPEGMWLAETAVDSETLELLADHGIRFTILAPGQCKRVRALAKSAAADPETDVAWTDTDVESLDTRYPYIIRLETGKEITVFFYDGERSRAVAFEGILNSGDHFAARLMGGFSTGETPQIVHIATDGESYGHHHKHGEMALSYALKLIEKNHNVRLTNYAEFLEKFAPEYEAQIVENSSWSCVHGLGRWCSNCGCHMGGHPEWTQQWRRPLRDALDWLRDAIIPMTERVGASLFEDVWAARDAYIDVILDRGSEITAKFLASYTTHELSAEERITALKLMEMQRHALLMYTSCGWFFDEVSGIETVQIIAYASRVLQLAAEVLGEEGAKLEAKFIELLRKAKSNIPECEDGAAIYERQIKKLQVGLEHVAAHYGISSIFTSYPDEAELFCYSIRRLTYEVITSGRGRLLFGQARIASQITQEPETVIFAVVHFGDQNITAVVKRYDPSRAEEYKEFVERARKAVIGADFPALIRLFDQLFQGRTYAIQSLFKDEQRRIVKLILESTITQVESSLIAIYEDHASLLHFLGQTGLPKPPALSLAATFAVNAGLKRALESEPIDALQVRAYRELASADKIEIDGGMLGFISDQKMKRAMVRLHADFKNMAHLENALLSARTLKELPFNLNIWQAQNIWYDTLKLSHKQEMPDEWKQKFLDLGTEMRIRVDELIVEEDADLDLARTVVATAVT